MREKWLVKADDVVVCIDAATGKTLWKNVFALKSMNQPSHKGGAANNTPCVGGGKVFAMGPGGTLYGIEIATGKVLWERTGMSAEGVVPWSGARNMCTAPVYAGDTLIMPDHGTTIRGIDPATGKDPGQARHVELFLLRWTDTAKGGSYDAMYGDGGNRGEHATMELLELFRLTEGK
jgi:outer membrane protein assembly factor BamB